MEVGQPEVALVARNLGAAWDLNHMRDKMRRNCGTNSYQHSIGDNTFLTDPNFEPLRPMASFGPTFRCAKIFGWQG
jgi:hypothetical protein